jgi:ABC-type dipeptide/oligopeptide/nickel transport system permease component
MQAYIAKRFLLFIPTLLMANLVAFLLLRVIPGDPAEVKLAGETGDSNFSQAELHALQVKLGTDQPLYVQWQVAVGHGSPGFRRVDVLR